MFTNFFLDTTTIGVNVVDSLQKAIHIVSQSSDNLLLFKSLTAIVTITMPFVFTFVVLIIVFYYKFKKDKLQYQERLKMIEKGILPTPVVEKKVPIIIHNTNQSTPVWVKLLLGFGVGLFLGMIFDRLGFDNSASYWSMIFICMAIMFIFGDGILGTQKRGTEVTLKENNSEKKIESENNVIKKGRSNKANK